MEEQERNHPREQTTGAAKEVLLSQRGILDISITIFQENFTHPFLARKRKEGKPASETRPLPIKKLHIHSLGICSTAKEIIDCKRCYYKSATFILSQVNSSSQLGHGLRVQLCPKNFLSFVFIF